MEQADTPRGSQFWRFSLSFYARPDVAPACLVLQDEGGADVNVMLFLLFLAEGGRTVSRNDVIRIDAETAAWREEAVKPLRTLRRKLKTGIGTMPLEDNEAMRNLVKKVELESERLEQEFLARLASGIGTPGFPRAEAARSNLAVYAAHLGGVPDKALQIVLKAFTDAPPWDQGR
jgi:uncharacterized protein (TIGR02444 family)